MIGDQTIVCAGTLSAITCYRVASLLLDGYGEHAEAMTLLGNDAVIVARLLHAAREPVSCLLIGPTDGDERALGDAAPGLEVRTAGRRSGPVTRSATLEATDGRRYWLLPPAPPTPDPSPLPPPVAGAWVYVDLYDELEDTVIAWLARWAPSRLVVNLSGSRHSAKSARLAPFHPLLIQASLPHTYPAAALEGAARKLRSAASASYTLVSAGPGGFALAGPAGSWQRRPQQIVTGTALGSGAALSAGAVAGLAHGADGADLADAAADSVAAYLGAGVPS
ncbi:hypothetical protein [Actinomadura sp. 9N407]|uniref:hypothetical protein n=1 Tax=Actinomadura sp. 9N407 TaxID=3375154 RepID=UPI0037AADA66